MRLLLGIRAKLLLLLLLSIVLALSLAGVSLAFLIERFHQQDAEENFRRVFSTVEQHLKTRRETLWENVGFLSSREDIIAAVSMIGRYQEPARYQPLVFDPEKQRLAETLRNEGKAGGVGQMAVYDASGRLISFFINEAPGVAGYVSYDQAGSPSVRVDTDRSHRWVRGELPPTLKVEESELGAKGVHYRRCPHGLDIEALAEIHRERPDGSTERVGFVKAAECVDRAYVEQVASRSRVGFGLWFDDGWGAGTFAGLEPLELGAAPELFEAGRSRQRSWLDHDDFFAEAFHVKLAGGGKGYFVAAQQKAVVGAEVRHTQQVVLAVLLLCAVIILPLGFVVAHRSISTPVKRLADGAAAIGRGDYQASIAVHSQDELGRLARLFNEMAARLRAREQALSESEERFRGAFEQAAVGMAHLSPDGRWVRANQTLCNLLGYTHEELLELSYRDVTHPDDFARDAEAFEAVVAGHLPTYSTEKRYMRSDGRVIWVNLILSPVKDAEERTKYLLSIVKDISEQKAAERALRASERKYRTLVDNLPQRIFLKDAESRYVSCNRYYAEDLGLEPDAIRGRTDYDFFPSELADQYRADDRKVVRSGEGVEVEERYVSNGKEIFIRTVKSPVRDEQGAVAGVLGIIWDITERRRIEDRLRQSAAVFESTAEGVIITDGEGRITAVNKAFTHITGYSEGEALGRNPAFLQSGRHDPEFYEAMWDALRERGQWQGEVWNRRKDGDIYPQWMTISTVRNDAGDVVFYVGVFSDITAIKRSQERLNYIAHHDPLTELPNRLLFTDRLEHAIHRARRDGSQLAVLFMDLDRFKNINDSLGHPIGDQLLQAVAQRLRENVREEDTLARLGGDEFTLLMEGIASPKDAAVLARKLLRAFEAPFEVRGHRLHLGVSIGLSTFPGDGEDAPAVVKNADAAMYRAKESGRNTYQFYTSELTAHAVERLQMETALRHALGNGEFTLCYQPQIQLPSRELVGAEALIRWRHPESGSVPPLQFIPVAEESGLIIPIGAWVLREACRQARAWLDAGLPLRRMAVNLSGVQVERGDIVKCVEEALGEVGLEPGYLELEITESTLMGQPERAVELLTALRRLGVELAVDDFGTGYSSLQYLKRFPIHRLKIDQSFIRDMPEDANDAAITQAVIALAKSLQLQVIAEGVETETQEAYLIAHGCDEAQGYFYGRPVPAEAFADAARSLGRRG